MKKLLKNLFFFGAVGSVAILASCGGDDETVTPGPSIEVDVTGVDITGTQITAVEGETAEFTVNIVAAGGFNTLNIYTSIDGGAEGTPQVITRNDSEVTLGADGTEATVTVVHDFTAEDVDKEIDWRFEAVDDNNETADATISATVEAAPVEVVTHTETLIGGQSNATAGSFYNAIDDEVYTYVVARDDESANVDFLFFFGETNQYTIAAIDDSQAAIAFNAAIAGDFEALGADIFATRNSTKFKVTEVTTEEFDAIENVEELLNAIGTDIEADASLVNNLSVNDVFAFTLAEGRGSVSGLAKVTATGGSSGADRSITIQVKIEPTED